MSCVSFGFASEATVRKVLCCSYSERLLETMSAFVDGVVSNRLDRQGKPKKRASSTAGTAVFAAERCFTRAVEEALVPTASSDGPGRFLLAADLRV